MKIFKTDANVVLITNVGQYKEDWIKAYFEPNNAYSDCGGRLTLNIGDDHIGTHFFSHCATPTFKDFIAKVSVDYLINKLFQTQEYIDVEDGEELIKSLFENELFYRVKEARSSGAVCKEELRDLYEDLIGREFRDIGELSNMIGSDSWQTMSVIFNDDWYYDGCFKKRNHKYKRQELAIQALINYCGESA